MSLLQKYTEEVNAFVHACHRLDALGYVTSQGGNLAWRIADDVIVITATCLAKGAHTPEDVVFIDGDGGVLEGRNRPTGELPIYLSMFRQRPDVRSIVHCHPPACCALAIRDGENPLELPLFPEVILEIGPAPLVPYATPLSEELAGNFLVYLQRYNAFLMENHGVIMVGPRDVSWTAGLLRELESAADSILRALATGGLKVITPERLAEMDKIMDIRSLSRVGAPGVHGSLVDLYASVQSGGQ
jgi:L-fuculose-phosphate aldolase